MTPDERHRLHQLEMRVERMDAEFEHMSERLAETNRLLSDAMKTVGELRDILLQGRGMRLVFQMILALGGSGGVIGLIIFLQKVLTKD